MAYSTAAEVRLILVGVNSSPATDYDLTANQLSDAQVEAEIANADSQIDAMIGGRYTVPFEVPVPPLIHNLSIDIAAYLSDLRFRGAKEYANELNPFYLRYQRALQLLNSVAMGDLDIPGGTDNGTDVVDGNSIAINPYEGTLMTTQNIFTRWPEGTIRDD